MSTSALQLQEAEMNLKGKKLISKRRRTTLPQWGVAWIVLIPALILVCMFMLYPIVNTFLYAFMQNLFYLEGAGSFALGQYIASIGSDPIVNFGIGNFIYVLQQKDFLGSILNTAILTVVEVPLTIIVSLLIATFLNSIKVLKGFYQTIFFLPYVTNTIALGLVFSIFFSNAPGGLMNVILNKVFGQGIPTNWLNISSPYVDEPATKFHQGIVIVIYSLWNGIAFKILVFMSGLATIDSQYYNAAKIDGASNFTIWRRITLPLLSPQILYITITSFIGAFKMYTGVMAVYTGADTTTRPYYMGGVDGNDWLTVVGWIYRNLDAHYDVPGYCSAASLILLCIIMLITLVQFGASKKRVHY